MSEFMSHCADVYPSLPGHVVESGNAGTSVCLAQAFLPFSFAVGHTILRAVGTKHVVQVATVAPKTVGQGKAKSHVIVVVFGNVGIPVDEFTDNGRGLGQLFRVRKRLAGRGLTVGGYNGLSLLGDGIRLLSQPCQGVKH